MSTYVDGLFTVSSDGTNIYINSPAAGPKNNNSKFNTIIGFKAGASIASLAVRNTMVGAEAGNKITNGTDNILVGHGAGPNITTGSYNLLIGGGAGYSLTTGESNIIFSAAEGGFSLTTGNSNVLIGGGAGASLETGSRNILLGPSAGLYITTGSNNVIIGGNDGDSISTKNNNIILSDGNGNIRAHCNESGNWTFSGTISSGPAGPIGHTGSRGFTGSKGEAGFVGSAGPAGGPIGPIGYTGSTGAQGAQGLAGPAGGYTGSQGIRGNTGLPGRIGFTGFTGSRGSLGPTGAPGVGRLGFTGSRGAPGVRGFAGSQGSIGNFTFTGTADQILVTQTPSNVRFKLPNTINVSVAEPYFLNEAVDNNQTISPDWEDGSFQALSVSANFTLGTPVNMPIGGTLTLVLWQDRTGSHTINVSPNYLFANGQKTFSTAPNSVDVLTITKPPGYNLELQPVSSMYLATLTNNFSK